LKRRPATPKWLAMSWLDRAHTSNNQSVPAKKGLWALFFFLPDAGSGIEILICNKEKWLRFKYEFA
jgi:hypothetical protein